MKGDREACLEAGMDGFVPKPIQSARLLEMLEHLASGSKPDSSAEVERDDIDSSDSLDEAALMTLVGGDQKLAELADLFLEDLDPRVTEITAAVTELDADRLRAGAHVLRGSAGSLKAETVAAAAGALEAMGRSSQMDGVQRALEELNVALANLRPRLVELAARA